MAEYFVLGSGTLFHIKCEVSTKQLLVADSVERRDWHTGIELTFYVYALYVGPSGEYISLIFYSFLLFLTYVMLSHNCNFPCLSFFFTPVLSEMMDKLFRIFMHQRSKQLTGVG